MPTHYDGPAINAAAAMLRQASRHEKFNYKLARRTQKMLCVFAAWTAICVTIEICNSNRDRKNAHDAPHPLTRDITLASAAISSNVNAGLSIDPTEPTTDRIHAYVHKADDQGVWLSYDGFTLIVPWDRHFNDGKFTEGRFDSIIYTDPTGQRHLMWPGNAIDTLSTPAGAR